MEDQQGTGSRRERIVELLKQSQPTRKPKRRTRDGIRVRGNGNVVVGGNLLRAATDKPSRRRELEARIQQRLAQRDAAMHRYVWNGWNFARIPLLLSALAFAYALLRFDSATPFPGWQMTGLMLLLLATCIVMFFLDRVRRACIRERDLHDAAVAAINEKLAVL